MVLFKDSQNSFGNEVKNSFECLQVTPPVEVVYWNHRLVLALIHNTKRK